MSVCQEWTEAYSLVKVGREGGDEEGGPREDLEERKGAQGEGFCFGGEGVVTIINGQHICVPAKFVPPRRRRRFSLLLKTMSLWLSVMQIIICSFFFSIKLAKWIFFSSTSLAKAFFALAPCNNQHESIVYLYIVFFLCSSKLFVTLCQLWLCSQMMMMRHLLEDEGQPVDDVEDKE